MSIITEKTSIYSSGPEPSLVDSPPDSHLIIYLPTTTTDQYPAPRRNKITVFNILLFTASDTHIRHKNDTRAHRHWTSGFGEMRCLFLLGEMNDRVWEAHHPPLQPAYSP